MLNVSLSEMQFSMLAKIFELVLGLILAAAPLFAAGAFEKVTDADRKLIEYKKVATAYSASGKAWPYNDGKKVLVQIDTGILSQKLLEKKLLFWNLIKILN